MEVSWNRGNYPKSSILMGFSILKHPFLPPFQEPPIVLFFSRWGRCRPVQRRGRNWLVSFLSVRINCIRCAAGWIFGESVEMLRDVMICHDMSSSRLFVNQFKFTTFLTRNQWTEWLGKPENPKTPELPEGSHARPPASAWKWRNCRCEAWGISWCYVVLIESHPCPHGQIIWWWKGWLAAATHKKISSGDRPASCMSIPTR